VHDQHPNQTIDGRGEVLTRAKQEDIISERATPGTRINIVRSGKELVKTGMIASATAMVLTGFRLVKPLNPLHRFAGIAFLGFSLWHVVQNEKIAKRKHLGRQA